MSHCGGVVRSDSKKFIVGEKQNPNQDKDSSLWLSPSQRKLFFDLVISGGLILISGGFVIRTFYKQNLEEITSSEKPFLYASKLFFYKLGDSLRNLDQLLPQAENSSKLTENLMSIAAEAIKLM